MPSVHMETVFPKDHLAKIDEAFGLPVGTLDNHDVLGSLIGIGMIDYEEKILFGKFVVCLSSVLCDACHAPEPIYIKPWPGCPKDRIEDGYAKATTMGRLGMVISSTNGRWYLQQPPSNLLVMTAKLLHRSPVSIITFVETSCHVTVQAEAAKMGVVEWQVSENLDLTLPLYKILFCDETGEGDHEILVKDGEMIQSFWKKKRSFSKKMDDDACAAIKEHDYCKLAGVDKTEACPSKQIIQFIQKEN